MAKGAELLLKWRVCFRSLSRRGSWVQIPPPALEFSPVLSVIYSKKLSLDICEWGLKFQHTFTGKGRASDDCNYCTH